MTSLFCRFGSDRSSALTRACAAVLGFALFCAPHSAQSAGIQPHEQFAVIQVQGKALVKRDSKEKKKPVKRGDVLFVNDTVFTESESFLTFSIADGSFVTIGPNSQYRFLPVTEGERNFWTWSFELIIGTMRAIIRKTSPEDKEYTKFKVNTKAGTAGVRGTVIYVTYSEPKVEGKVAPTMDLSVTEGRAFLGEPGANSYDADSVFVDAGTCYRIVDGGTPKRLPKGKCKGEPFGPKQSAEMQAAGSNRQKRNARADVHSPPDETCTAETLAENNQALLSAVAAADQNRVVQLLAKDCLDVNAYTSEGNTALMMASGMIDGAASKTIQLALLKKGADVDRQNKDGMTALMFAAQGGTLERIILLQNYNANLCLRNKDGRSALDLVRGRSYFLLKDKGNTDATEASRGLYIKQMKKWRRGVNKGKCKRT